MNRSVNNIERLIAELCPEGVEFRELKEVVDIFRGRRLTKSLLSDAEKYPVYHGGLEPLGYYSQSNRIANTVMVINVGASAATVGYSFVDFWSSDGCFCIGHSDLLIARFLYYALLCQENSLRSKIRFAGIPTLDVTSIERIKISVPPLAVQEEIVKILDTFSTLETELEAVLEAELEARKKQYEYYREELLTFGDEVEWKTLGEIGTLIRGNGLQKKDFVQDGIGCIHYGQIYTYYGTYTDKTKSFVTPELAMKLKKIRKGDLVITSTSENIEDVCKAVAWIGEGEIVTGGHATIFKHQEDPKYLSYYFRTSNFSDQKRKYAKGTKVIDVSARDLGKIKIPIPTLAEQQRIVAILDKFDALVNDLSYGLPAELNARRKQYEYYRNKLLTFKPLNKEHAG